MNPYWLVAVTLSVIMTWCYILVRIVIWKCDKEASEALSEALQRADKDVVDVWLDEL